VGHNDGYTKLSEIAYLLTLTKRQDFFLCIEVLSSLLGVRG